MNVANLIEFAEELQADRQGAKPEWLKSLNCARMNLKFMQLSAEDLAVLAKACQSPAQLNMMMRWLYQEGRSSLSDQTPFRELCALADGSKFPLCEWVDAIEVFTHWMVNEGRTGVGFDEIVKYLSCCTELPDAKLTNESFAVLVTSALDVYDLEL